MILAIIIIISLLAAGAVITVKVIIPALKTNPEENPKPKESTPKPKKSLSENQLFIEYKPSVPKAESLVSSPAPVPIPLHIREPEEIVLQRLKKSLTNIYQMPEEFRELATTYNSNKDQVYQNSFMLGPNPNLSKITSFGIALLHKFAEEGPELYLEIVGHLISKLNTQLPSNLVQIPTSWNQKYFSFCVKLPRMLSMFEILGSDQSIKEICHRRIREINTSMWKSLDWNVQGIEMSWIAIPRLVTNYFFDTPTYDRETKPNYIGSLQDIMKVKFRWNIDQVIDRIYVEKSNVFHGTASYWSLVESGGFYASVFRALGFQADLDEVTPKIFDKVLHNSIDFVPLGLFGITPEIRISKIMGTNWPNYQRRAKMDVGIFPVSGLGVFKSEQFVFWVRVQRWYLSCYESDQENFELAPGWMQMRKLYLKGVEYEGNLEWQKIKMQPGVISSVDDSDNFEHLKPHNKERVQHDLKDVFSHLGTLMDEDRRVLYWKNEYKFDKLYGDTKFVEFGVCTDNGVVIRLEILNLTGKILRVRVQDDDIGSKMKFECRSSRNGFATVGKTGTTVINWRQVFDLNRDPKEIVKNEKEHMAFTYEGDNYEIEPRDHLHFVLKNSQVLLAGSFEKSWSYNIEYGYKNRAALFEFNPGTLMWTVIEETL